MANQMNININESPDYLRNFLTYISVVKGRTQRTVNSYYFDLSIFLRYLKIQNGFADSNIPFEDIPISDVPISFLEKFTLLDAYQYLNYLATERNNSQSTRARRVTALKTFYDYLSSKAMLIKENPVLHLDRPKEPDTLPKFLDLDQSTQLLNSTESHNPERDYCILTLFLNCGMRLSELVGLNLEDYSKQQRTLRLFGKGQKERIVYLNDACISAIDKWLEVRPKVDSSLKAMFILMYAGSFKRISNRRVQRIVEDQLKRAGLGNLGISTHKLRHTCATIMYEYGHVDPMVLRDVLGHKSVATTQIYTHLSDKDKQRAAESTPLANVKKLTNRSDDSSDDSDA